MRPRRIPILGDDNGVAGGVFRFGVHCLPCPFPNSLFSLLFSRALRHRWASWLLGRKRDDQGKNARRRRVQARSSVWRLSKNNVGGRGVRK